MRAGYLIAAAAIWYVFIRKAPAATTPGVGQTSAQLQQQYTNFIGATPVNTPTGASGNNNTNLQPAPPPAAGSGTDPAVGGYSGYSSSGYPSDSLSDPASSSSGPQFAS